MTLTNERQQELIADCQEEIRHLKEHILRLSKHHVDFDLSQYESQLQRQEIALASLTADTSKLAELAAKVRNVREDASEFDGDRRGMWEHQEEQERLLLEEAVKYTAPPVPVIKLPGDLQDAFEEGNRIPTQTSRCGNSYCSHSFSNWDGQKFMNEFDGFVKGINFIKRLNGLGE
ncbi:hypothetical protein [Tatumella citrea]|uniref:Uncharacterized protein n=1 Tax=Tatumella citrea TaxID=53336 RepID=A0A1Y0LAB9_TATCI|nr:hypothetical protein [Tatumella citrea]ARU94599.1 hypothetical protein A7K98_13015 [Tatumella citrea]ARU98637.1 hypothetical protein A7K99_13005 [Tatumella citrea]